MSKELIFADGNAATSQKQVISDVNVGGGEQSAFIAKSEYAVWFWVISFLLLAFLVSRFARRLVQNKADN
ncbi:hypothetical protein [Aliamphritea ceti]|uniref:hypothetical protein n=1 Tax=Aliamphritea ceti TaxID=1524258 RepID=UPI0021C2C49B|nr:hypothetical protein [Aliamphritea ceti]